MPPLRDGWQHVRRHGRGRHGGSRHGGSRHGGGRRGGGRRGRVRGPAHTTAEQIELLLHEAQLIVDQALDGVRIPSAGGCPGLAGRCAKLGRRQPRGGRGCRKAGHRRALRRRDGLRLRRRIRERVGCEPPVDERRQCRDRWRFLEELPERHRHAETLAELGVRLRQEQRVEAEVREARVRVERRVLDPAQVGQDRRQRGGDPRGSIVRPRHDRLRVHGRRCWSDAHGGWFVLDRYVSVRRKSGSRGVLDRLAWLGRIHGVDPIALMVKGIGRELHATAGAAVDRGPVDVHTGRPELAEGAEELGLRVRFGPAGAPEGRHDGALLRRPRVPPCEGRQRLAGTDLEEGEVGSPEQATDRIREPDGRSEVVGPIVSAHELLVRRPVARHRADQRDPLRVAHRCGDPLPERGHDRLHHRRVRSMLDGQGPRRDVPGSQLVLEPR